MYDVVLIGTSPLVVLEATHLALNGKSVLLVEKESSIGGAWKTFDLGPITKIDYGCHIINPIENAYEFIANALKVELEVMNPKPASILQVFNNICAKDSNKIQIYRIYKKILNVLKFIFKKDIRQAYIESRRFYSLFIGLIKNVSRKKVEYLYPKGGAQEMIRKIEEKAVKAGVNIIYNTKIESINIEDNTCVIYGKKINISARRLIISSGSSVDTIIVENELCEKKDMPRFFPHIFLHIKDNGLSTNEFSYIYVHEHEFIERISNITKHVEDESNSEKTIKIMVTLTESTSIEDFDEKKVYEVLKFFEKYNLISKENVLLNYKTYDYVVNYMNDESLKYYENISGGVIKYIYSTNIAAAINQYRDKWSNLY